MNTKIYRVGIYLRLSREDFQQGESGSITTQRELLMNYINDNKLTYVDEYVDDGVSGTTFNRQGFNRMIKDIENKKIDMVITKDTSRLGRDHIEFGYYVERYFPEHQIRYVAVTDGIDTSVSSSNNDMLLFKSAFNDMYVKDISNKIRTSLYTKKRNGKFVGCYAPYGYRKNPYNKYELLIDEESSKIVKMIFSVAAKGFSVTKICEILTQKRIKTPSEQKNMHCGHKNLHLGVWNNRTVTDILKNPTYIGNLTQGRNKKVNYKSKKRIHQKKEDWIIKEGGCPSIINQETFNIVQNMLTFNRNQQKHGITSNLLLRGLIYCKDCHHTIGFRCNKQETKQGLITRIYGNCNYWSKRKNLHVCTPHSIKYQNIEDIVLKDIKREYNLIDENKFKFLIENYQDNKKKDVLRNKIFSIKNGIKNNYSKIDMMYKDKLNGIINDDTYLKIYKEIVNDIDDKVKLVNTLENDLIKLNGRDKLELNYFIDITNISRDLIVHIIDRIEIGEGGDINIYYKYKNSSIL